MKCEVQSLMHTNTSKRQRVQRNITAGRAGPSNIPQDLLEIVLPGGVSDTVRKVAESVRGGKLIQDRDHAVWIIQKYMRFWFSEIGKLIRNCRNAYAYLINNLAHPTRR
jgi:hypothetical protein